MRGFVLFCFGMKDAQKIYLYMTGPLDRNGGRATFGIIEGVWNYMYE